MGVSLILGIDDEEISSRQSRTGEETGEAKQSSSQGPGQPHRMCHESEACRPSSEDAWTDLGAHLIRGEPRFHGHLPTVAV